MVNIEVNTHWIEEQKKTLAKLLVNDPDMRKRVRKCIQQELARTRKLISQDAKGVLSNDPRDAYKAVKRTVYRRILGGNVSILASRRAGARYELRKSRKLDQNPHQRGGNRRVRSDRTRQIDTYYGKDRGFILRFINSGTQTRQTRFGNRGSISARNWFEVSGGFHLDEAADNLGKMIEQEMQAVWNQEQH